MASALESQHNNVEKTETNHAQSSLTDHLHASAKTDSGTQGHLKSAQQSADMVEKGTLPPCEVAHCGNDTRTPKKPEDHHQGTKQSGDKTDGQADNHRAQLGHHESQKHADKNDPHHKPDHHNGPHKPADNEGPHHGSHKPLQHDGKRAPENSDAVKGSNNSAAEKREPKNGAPEACGVHGAGGEEDFKRMLQRSGIGGDDAKDGKTKGTGGEPGITSPTQRSDGNSLTDGRSTSSTPNEGQSTIGDGRKSSPGTDDQHTIGDGRKTSPGTDGQHTIGDGRKTSPGTDGQHTIGDGRKTEGDNGSSHYPTDRISPDAPKFKAGAHGDSPEKEGSGLALGSKGDSPDPAWLKSQTNLSSGKGREMSSSHRVDTPKAQNFKIVFPNGIA